MTHVYSAPTPHPPPSPPPPSPRPSTASGSSKRSRQCPSPARPSDNHLVLTMAGWRSWRRHTTTRRCCLGVPWQPTTSAKPQWIIPYVVYTTHKYGYTASFTSKAIVSMSFIETASEIIAEKTICSEPPCAFASLVRV